MNYAQAGVNREAGDRLVGRFATMTRKTQNTRVKSSIGGYASLYELDRKRWLAASTDGVGTKLKLAMRLGLHHTVGIDLVAMSVNDLLCVGAKPLFFLDYLATGKLEPKVLEKVVAGVVKGCQMADCALVGGETAEMPGFYSKGEYDLAGFAVGVVDRSKVLPASIKAGDHLIGLASSGFHSNGFSLLRKWIPKGSRGNTLAKNLLEPTRIYVKPLMGLIEMGKIKALSHITGSGFLNVPRISSRFDYEIELPRASERPKVFSILKERKMGFKEAAATFNLGVGMVLAVDPRKSKEVLRRLKTQRQKAWLLGKVLKKRSQNSSAKVIIREANGSSVILS